MSGECLCGAYAREGELKRLEDHFPATAKVIADLEETVREIGFTWGWEDKPPGEKELNRVMENIFPGFKDIKETKREAKAKKENQDFMPMCHRCEFAKTA
jgi:hypothetical protein